MRNTFLDYAQAGLIGVLLGLAAFGFAAGMVVVLVRFAWVGLAMIVAVTALLLALVTHLKAKRSA